MANSTAWLAAETPQLDAFHLSTLPLPIHATPLLVLLTFLLCGVEKTRYYSFVLCVSCGTASTSGTGRSFTFPPDASHPARRPFDYHEITGRLFSFSPNRAFLTVSAAYMKCTVGCKDADWALSAFGFQVLLFLSVVPVSMWYLLFDTSGIAPHLWYPQRFHFNDSNSTSCSLVLWAATVARQYPCPFPHLAGIVLRGPLIFLRGQGRHCVCGVSLCSGAAARGHIHCPPLLPPLPILCPAILSVLCSFMFGPLQSIFLILFCSTDAGEGAQCPMAPLPRLNRDG